MTRGIIFDASLSSGGWNDASELDRSLLTEILGEPYETWVQRVYPLTKKEEPPVLLDGKSFRPVSRYESWQQLSHFPYRRRPTSVRQGCREGAWRDFSGA